MKFNLKKILGKEEYNIEGFVEALERGVVHDAFPPNLGYWRVSSLVGLWDQYAGGGKCAKLLYLYLLHGKEKEFETSVVKTFHQGTVIHDVVKNYFHKSPHFKVKHEELSIQHPTLPLTGTMDLVVEWDKYPGEEFIVEIKSVGPDYVDNEFWGAKRKPFRKARWQAGIYSHIYKAKPIVLYYNKANSELYPHLLEPEDYDKDVKEIFAMCEQVYQAYQKHKKQALPVLGGICKRKPKEECPYADYCDAGQK